MITTTVNEGVLTITLAVDLLETGKVSLVLLVVLSQLAAIGTFFPNVRNIRRK
jgi:hypothetical protein